MGSSDTALLVAVGQKVIVERRFFFSPYVQGSVVILHLLVQRLAQIVVRCISVMTISQRQL